jgi:hypothetical protein
VRATATANATSTTTAGIASVVTLMSALFVILFGVLATSGAYGSRVAWLLGVALPLLALTMLLAWLSLGGPRRGRHFLRVASGDRHGQAGRAVFLVAASLFALPLALAAVLLLAYAVLFAMHGLSLLL